MAEVIGPNLSHEKLNRIYRDRVSATDEYWHWDELRFRTPPVGLNHREWWLATKTGRNLQPLPLMAGSGDPFQYCLWHTVAEHLQFVDLNMGGIVQTPEHVTNPDTRDRYLIRSLIDEAITSSQLEGAVTTGKVAREMIRDRRKPRDKSERMILNNYETMQHIRTLKTTPITPEAIFELHRIVSRETLDDPTGVARFRRNDENIRIEDMYGTVFHVPPRADELPDRMNAMCRFANGELPEKGFLHPVLRAIILHFWLAYDHPFVDGNGRTARALFYWCMLRNEYWLCEFISISHFLNKAPTQYYRAFLHTETDDNDLTYFILHQLTIIRRAISSLHDFIRDESERFTRLRARLHSLDIFNHRQVIVIEHAIRHPNERYTIDAHQLSHGVAYETARRDLRDLAGRGVLQMQKTGRAYFFRPIPNLESRLENLSKVDDESTNN